VGAYILSASDGGFVWTGDYSCVPGTQVYAYTLGGAAGGVSNSASALMAVLGNCPSSGNFNATSYVWINEVSTVAAAYAFSGFATDAKHVSSSGSALAQVGMANAFENATNLATLSTGVALAVTPAGNGVAPQAAVNTLANILAACVASNGPLSSACSTLFLNAQSNGSSGTVPTDTAIAAINIAHNPGAQVSVLYSIASGTTPFAPALFAQPTDFTLAIKFTGGGIDHPAYVALDGAGNVWATNLLRSTVSELASTGAPRSSVTGYTGGGMGEPFGIAIDLEGNAWVSNNSGAGTSEFSSAGAALSPATGFASCGANNSSHGIAIDGLGNVWSANGYGGSGCVAELASAGTALSPASGFGVGYLAVAYGAAVDATGAVWVTNQGGNSLTKLTSSGAPVSPTTGFTGGGLNVPDAVAIDSAGDVWVANAGNSSIAEMSSAGTPLSPGSGFRGGGLYQPQTIAIDGSGNVWVASFLGNNISEFSNSGAAISPPPGYNSQWSRGPDGIAIDGSGNVWVAAYDGNSLVEFIGAATPVVTPLALGVKNNTLGTRP
jgi:streptogramin lyase